MQQTDCPALTNDGLLSKVPVRSEIIIYQTWIRQAMANGYFITFFKQAVSVENDSNIKQTDDRDEKIRFMKLTLSVIFTLLTVI